MSDLEPYSVAEDPEKILKEISIDPCDVRFLDRLEPLVRNEKFHKPKDIYDPIRHFDMASATGLLDMARKMASATTLEEKYRLLVEAVPYDYSYTHWYKRNNRNHEPDPITWYDFIIAHQYETTPSRTGKAFNEPYDLSVYSALKDVVATDRWGRAADLGSGTLELTRRITPFCDQVVALDIFEFMHHVSRNRLDTEASGKVGLVAADAVSNLPIVSAAFDLVVSNGMTAFISRDELQLLASELSRVMTKGGSFFEPMVEDGLRDAIKHEFSQSYKALIAYMIGEMSVRPAPGQPVIYRAGASEINKIFQQAGFLLIEHRYEGGAVVTEFINGYPDEAEKLMKAFKDENFSESVRIAQSMLENSTDLNTSLRLFSKLSQIPYSGYVDGDGGPRVYYDFSLPLYADTFISPLVDFVLKHDLPRDLHTRIDRILYQNVLKIVRVLNLCRYHNDEYDEAILKLNDLKKLFAVNDHWSQLTRLI